MNVLFFGFYPIMGGMERYGASLIKGIVANHPDCSFTIISECTHIAYEKELLSVGCSIVNIPSSRKRPIAFAKQILKLFAQKKKTGAVAHINIMSFCNFFLFRALKKSRIPTIIVGHSNNTNRGWKGIVHRFFRYYYRQIGTKIAVSEEAGSFTFGRRGSFRIISNAIDPTPFIFNQENRRQIRETLGISNNCLCIGQVGRICQPKNQAFSIEVAKKLSEKGFEFKLLFIGNDQLPQLKRRYEKDPILGNLVLFLGELDTPKYYSAFDVMLLPSLFEGAGLVLYEAFANGLPVVASTNVPPPYFEGPVEFCRLDANEWADTITNRPKKRVPCCYGAENLKRFGNAYYELYCSLIGDGDFEKQ